MARNKRIETKIDGMKVIFDAGCFDTDNLTEEEARDVARVLVQEKKREKHN